MVIDRFSRVALGGRGISRFHSFPSYIGFKKVGERGRLRSESFTFMVRCPFQVWVAQISVMSDIVVVKSLLSS